jgi:hypothetical protein
MVNAIKELEARTQIREAATPEDMALSAIQRLNQKLEKELQARDGEIEELKQAVSELKRLIRQPAAREGKESK